MSANLPGSSPATLRNARFVGQPGLAEVLAGKDTLGRGSRAPAVRAVQQALIDMGFSLHGGADGAFGQQSLKAVRNFQVHARSAFPEVQPTGTVDAATLRALDTLAPPPGQRGQSGNLPVPRFGTTALRVVVVKDEHRTFLFDQKGALQGIFGNAVGARATQTDTGLRRVRGKLDEAGARAEGLRLWGAPVFGARLIDLSKADGSRSGEELHGTNAPERLGEDVSKGCVRHDNPSIITLFNMLKVGDWVAVVDTVRDPSLGAPGAPVGQPPPMSAVA
jgi:peptidoglycan hydrolase-like protein with peptidoglycan-binding domain